VPYVMEFLVLPLTAAGAAGEGAGAVDVLFVAQLFARAPA
jgi:hypothetical protein